ncbi:hypothetical protein ACHHYP_02576 [Achlya hypogyna]|uniref:EF-hand domain-containing protein n=1 Tax=Achlya hypogyna TaxID=1202772 RepID=A0A1V9Z5W0_ACHHY|nr:hypothetical protein ACHHYP_02576 [Achlya hypogyna]
MTGGAGRRWLLVAVCAPVVESVVTLHVPSGSAYGFANEPFNATITAPSNVTNDLLIDIALNANDTRQAPVISPKPLVFREGATELNFTITGVAPGRYPMAYTLLALEAGNTTYALSADALVVVVVNDQWTSTMAQFGINCAALAAGLVFFVWRRSARRHLWVWGRSPAGLFEPEPFRDASPPASPSPLAAPTWQTRLALFWRLPCDGPHVVTACGVDAALFLRFTADAAVLFAALALLSCALLLPINMASGDGPTTSYQQATIANVPVRSPWLWGHVAMCFFAAAAVVAFVFKQHARLAQLYREDASLLGPRSVFIQAGLPLDVTNYALRQWISENAPEAPQHVSVVADLHRLHRVLAQRMQWSADLERLEALYLSGRPPSRWLRWCPGGSCCPSPADIWRDYTEGRPCRHHHALTEPLLDTDDADADVPPRVQRQVATLRARLAAVPEEIVASYSRRTGTGAAFAVFTSTAVRDAFLERCRRAQAPLAPCRALLRCSPPAATDDPASPLPSLVVQPAPEPHDIKWAKMTYRPQSLRRYVAFGLYHTLTVVLLVLFSTPASVLLYVNLQPGSPVYAALLAPDSALAGFVGVNWVLLTVLFYVSFLEPWLTESRRMRSFLTKGFAYLFLSSILFPSIGVTAIYAATRHSAQVSLDGAATREAKYVNDFLYKLCSNFFVSYVLQLTCLGAVMQLLRVGEKLVYQPWVVARAVTPAEELAARQPWPFYFGYDYAVLLSVFTIGLLGCVLSPFLAPCAAIFFAVKHVVTKYNFLYVHPRTPGRGNVARAASSLSLVCLVLVELAMTSVLSQVGRTNQWLALVLLTCAVFGVFVYWRVAVYRALEKAPEVDEEAGTTPLRRQESVALSRIVFRARSQEEIDAESLARQHQAYLNPYDVGLCMLSVLHRIEAQRTARLQRAFATWRTTTADTPAATNRSPIVAAKARRYVLSKYTAMLPRLPATEPSRAMAAAQGFRRKTPRPDPRKAEESPRKARYEARDGEDDPHMSYIPREFYVVETHAVPKYNPQQYKSTFQADKGLWETVLFPSLEPHTRQEVLYLTQALRAMESAPRPLGADTPALLEAEWRIYAVAFHELIRQMKFICKEQATVVTYLVSQLQTLFSRLSDHVRILGAGTLLSPPKTPAPPPTPPVPRKPTSHRRPPTAAAPEQSAYVAAAFDGSQLRRACPEAESDGSDDEGFVCSFCLEYSRDPSKEAARRSTLLQSIGLRRLGSAIEADTRKFKAILKMQALFRGYRVRRQKQILDRMRTKTIAATTIQKAFRRFVRWRRATARKKAQETWRKHMNTIMAVRQLQRRVRKFLQVGREYRESQLGAVINRFKLADRDLAACLEDKCSQLELLAGRLQGFQQQIHHIQALILPETPVAVPGAMDPVARCTDVHLALVELHHHVSELHAREQQAQREWEAALFQLREAHRARDEALRANVGFGHDDDDDDGWAVAGEKARSPSLVDTNFAEPPEAEIHHSPAQELFDTIKPFRYGKKWLAQTHLKHPAAPPDTAQPEKPIPLAVDDGGTERSASVVSVPAVPPEGHRGAVLMHRLRANAAVDANRPRRPLGWVKQLLFHIYETVALALREERHALAPDVAAALAHQFDLCLTLAEAQAVAAAGRASDSGKASSLPDIICQHFQAQFGLPQLVDQAIYDLAIYIHDFAVTDHDVQLFQSFLNGTRPRTNLAFFSYVRQLCAALSREDATTVPLLPFLDATSCRELIDVPHALKVAQILFRVRDETALLAQDPNLDLNGRTPSALFAQCRVAIEAKMVDTAEVADDGDKPLHAFNALLQPVRFHSHLQQARSPLRRRIAHPTAPALYFADFFEILCRFHAEAHLLATQREWIEETFTVIDADRDGAIHLDAFVAHLSGLPKAPTPRELQQTYRHALQVSLDRSKVPNGRVGPMGFRTFFGVVQRLLATKQLRPATLPLESGGYEDPTQVHDRQKLQTIMHRLTLDWLDKEPIAESFVGDSGRHLAPTLRALMVELTQALSLKPKADALEARLEQMHTAWDRYCAIVCVVLVLATKRAGGVNVVEEQLGDVDRAWNLCFSRAKDDETRPPL